ncbi:MAG: hypothetical protein ACKVS5_07275 [Parvularculaceae bacterium]
MSHKNKHSAHGENDKDDERFDARQLLTVLGKDLKGLEKRISVIAEGASAPLAEHLVDAGQDLHQSMQKFLERAGAVKDAAVEETKERADALHDQMTEHPLAAASSALALGYVLGRLTLTRKQHAAAS